jgi:hypothetical protein
VLVDPTLYHVPKVTGPVFLYSAHLLFEFLGYADTDNRHVRSRPVYRASYKIVYIFVNRQQRVHEADSRSYESLNRV